MSNALIFFLVSVLAAFIISKYRYGTFLPPLMEDEQQSPRKD